MRAMVWVLVAASAMGGGCAPETGDVFSDVDGLQPGADCFVDRDCPSVDCHGAPSCINGQCYTLKQERPTMCSFGVCTENAVCVPCVADEQCASVNPNVCATLTCGADGQCVGHVLPKGSRCLLGEGHCDYGNTCVKD